MEFQAFLIKYAEIGIKGKNRGVFEDALLHQMRVHLKHIDGDFRIVKEQGRIITKDQYFYDRYHPTNLGHTVMADSIINLFKKIDALNPEEESLAAYKMPSKALMSDSFEYISPLDISDDAPLSQHGNDGMGNSWSVKELDFGDFKETDKVLQCVEMDYDLTGTPEFPNNRMHVKGGRGLSFEAECKLLMVVIKDSADADVGSTDIYVDGKFALNINPRDIGWVHCNARIVFDNKTKEKHRIKVVMHEGDEDKKLTILGFGIR